MTREELRARILVALGGVVPELDPDALDPKERLREALDIDSMDFLNFVTALHAALGVDIPEKDYGRLVTLDACVDYLADHMPGR